VEWVGGPLSEMRSQLGSKANERRPPLAPLAPHQPRPARDAADALERGGVVRVEFRRALALRSEIRRAGWFH
jgi:hypothetical protein